jgi:saccharopepsin
MKTAAIVAAAAALAGGAEAGKHRMKLQKVPLEEQLKGATMHDFTRQLGQKYLKSVGRDFQIQQAFAPRGGHVVPVTNYMNAQCMYLPPK